MDDHGSQSYPRSSALRLSPKSKAPSPPALKTAESPGFSHWPPGNPHVTMETKENLTDRKLTLTVVLPGGVEEMTVVHGSKAQMDLLVALCAQYHLNPSSHTLELVTANKNIKFKPNALIGTFNADKVILKSKGEDKNKKTGPQMPEATVRMVINYKRTQKTILRVSPRVPLAELLPAICEKCEFNTDTTVLLRDAQSPTPLDLSSCLNDHAIREVYARDTKGQAASPACSVAPSCADISATCEDISPTCAGAVPPGKNKNQKEEENKGLFSMFRKSKKKSEQPTTASAPASPVLVTKPRPLSMALPCSNSSPLGSDAPKKRRAPQPPILVSQSQDAELGARRRLNSEPNARLDSDQRTGLSRGSSAESSLRRTKRKAPPPPTSPTPSVQDSAPPDENLQAANTLEEIREQEETTASVISAAGSSIQGDDSSLNMSPDHSLHSLSLDIETGSTMSLEGGEEDQSGDLSSDGNQLQSAVSDSATLIVRQPDGTDSSKVAVTDGGPVQAEDAVPHPVCDESPADGAEDDLPAPSPPPPVTQDAEAQACAPAGADPLQEVAENCSTSHPTGEDAQVQTDFMPLPEPPRQHTDEAPSSAHSLDSGSAGKTNVTTLTEELEPSDLKSASSHTSEASPRQDSPPRVPAAEKEPPAFAADAEPKPKPSNELTRDYIPKVGMTTYTIVPQKTLEKLRYFEVALTLETPDDEAPAEGQNVASLDLHEDAGQREQTEVPKEGAEPHSDSPSEDLLTSTTTSTTITTTTSTENTVNGVIPEPTHSFSPTSLHGTGRPSSLANGASQAGSPTEVKEMKVPPATKPKPTSFRLAQPKKAPGHYVTSAAEKSPVGSPASGFKETQGSAERPALPPPPPPPPPPSVQCQEETAGATNVQPSPTRGDKNASLVQMTRQSSLPSREPSIGLSLEKLRSFAAPRPFTPSSPSRFAQAVSSAVKRSQSLSHGPKSPPSSSPAPVSPVTSHSSVMESKGLCYLKDCEDGDADRDGSTLQREESNVQLTGDNSP
ncbi:cordon-bleu protein-like 1b isoform X2 [Cololabis saira]|nr:cordon-bleu protein-like 1b isoform X2 [Cololabis saira]